MAWWWNDSAGNVCFWLLFYVLAETCRKCSWNELEISNSCHSCHKYKLMNSTIRSPLRGEYLWTFEEFRWVTFMDDHAFGDQGYFESRPRPDGESPLLLDRGRWLSSTTMQPGALHLVSLHCLYIWEGNFGWAMQNRLFSKAKLKVSSTASTHIEATSDAHSTFR